MERFAASVREGREAGDPRPEEHNQWTEVFPIGDLLVRAASKWPSGIGLSTPDRDMSFSELRDAAESAARSLYGMGVRPGDRVGLLMPPCHDLAAAIFGAAMLGSIAVPINARYRERELIHVLRESDVVAVVTTDLDDEYVDRPALVNKAASEVSDDLSRSIVVLGTKGEAPHGSISRDEFVAFSDDVAPSLVTHLRRAVSVRQIAVMPYTSGTTGTPKGCLLPHEGVVRIGSEAARRWSLSSTDKLWDPLPMYGMGGIFPMMACLYAGATFMTMPHFDAATAIDFMEAKGCTIAYPVFPTISKAVIRHPRFEQANLGSVRIVIDTGQRESLEEAQNSWQNAKVISIYGSSETSAVATLGNASDPRAIRLGTCGPPFPGVELRVVDPKTHKELPAHNRGEIAIASPALFAGYYKDPEKTEQVLEDGWYYSGDLGSVDSEGRVTFLGRIKDMLKVGGENVAAAEIEVLLETHPGVHIAQIVGVPDDKYQEVPMAFVERSPGQDVSSEELVEFCKKQIASYKVPRHIAFTDEWPLSATNKIQKAVLRERALKELSSGAE